MKAHLLYSRLFLSLCLFLLGVTHSFAQLTANFTATPTSGCPPLVVSFTNATIPSTGTTYQWDLNNGTGIITLTNPGTSYLTAGTYTVTLTAHNGSLTSIKKQVITVFPSPTIHFTASDTAVCPYTSITFNNTTTGGIPGPVSYLWSSGDGYTSTATNFSHVYALPGNFNVTLNATNSSGCTSTLTAPALIHIFNPPNAVFSALNTHLCNPPSTAFFTNSTTGFGPLSYQWAFGDGSPASFVATPSHLYNSVGAYDVTLIATDGHTCKDTTVIPGMIKDSVFKATFSAPDSACRRSNITFNNTTGYSFLSCSWNYGDGSAVDTARTGHHIYITTGIYNVKLVTYNGYCYDTAVRSIKITPPITSFNVSPVNPCPAPILSTFSVNAPPGSLVQWSFGDDSTGLGNPTTHNYDRCKADTIRMIVTTPLGCTDTVYKPYLIYDIVTGLLNTFESLWGCAPHSVDFSYDDLKHSILPDYSIPIFFRPYPFTYTQIWDFGDGSPTTTSRAPSHNYPNPGIYHFNVKISTSNGCMVTLIDTVKVGVRPKVTFDATPTHTCANDNYIKFTIQTISGNPNAFYWKFGESFFDGSNYDTAKITYHHYTFPGLYSDTLIAYNDGCPDTAIRTNYILIDSPSAIAHRTVYCHPVNTVQFVDSSIGENYHIWMFGDGTTSTLLHPLHTFSAPAIYTTLLIDTNTLSGCRDTFALLINLTKPTIIITADDTTICKDQYVVLNATISGGYGPIYQWFAAGNSHDYRSSTFIDTFHVAGRYDVSFVVTDQNNCLDTVKKLNYILVAKPVDHFSITPSSICLAGGSTFVDASTDVSGTSFTNYKWIFGDGVSTNTTSPSISHTYSAIGTYSVKEIVTDNIGCKDSITQVVNVYHPTAAFSASKTALCAYVNTTFNNSSTIGGTYLWTFGDGSTSTLFSPAHNYSASGTYTVRLIVTDTHGCKDTALKPGYITVSKPTAAFTISDSIAICPPFAVSFFNLSAGGTSYRWTFGNGDSSLAFNPSIIYTTPSYNMVRLIVTNAAGCKDTAVRHVKIYGYAGAFSYNTDSGCVPLSVKFNADLSNVASVSSIVWDYSDGITSTASLSDTITHIYNNAGACLPKLIITDHTGCVSSSSGIDTIRIDAVVAGFKSLPSPACIGQVVRLIDTSHSYWSAISAHTFTFNDTSSISDTPSTIYLLPGTKTITLHSTDRWGCSDNDTSSLVIYQLPAIQFNPDSVICSGRTTLVSDSLTGGTWVSNNSGIAVVDSLSGLLAGVSVGTAQITYRLSDGCNTAATVTVNAFPDPGTIIGKSILCVGDTAIYSDIVAGGTWSVTSGNAVITSTGRLIALNTGVDTIKYTVSNFNCDSTTMKIINIVPLPDAGVISGKDSVCVDGVINFTETVSGGKWTSSNTNIASIDSLTGKATGRNLGLVTITYTTLPNTNGCIIDTTHLLKIIEPDFTISSQVTNISCYGKTDGSIVVSVVGGNPPFSYLWSNSNTSASISGLAKENYGVLVTEQATYCIVRDSFTISEPDSLSIAVEINDDVCSAPNGSIKALVTGGTPDYKYLWSNNATTETIAGLDAGNFQVTVSDRNGCFKIIQVPLSDSVCQSIIIHNAISPNGDGINDTWVLEGIEKYPGNKVQVFDKWGDLVFERTNYNNDWNGSGKNDPIPDGTYYYLIKLNSTKAGGKKDYTGSLMIKR